MPARVQVHRYKNEQKKKNKKSHFVSFTTVSCSITCSQCIRASQQRNGFTHCQTLSSAQRSVAHEPSHCASLKRYTHEVPITVCACKLFSGT